MGKYDALSTIIWSPTSSAQDAFWGCLGTGLGISVSLVLPGVGCGHCGCLFWLFFGYGCGDGVMQCYQGRIVCGLGPCSGLLAALPMCRLRVMGSQNRIHKWKNG